MDKNVNYKERQGAEGRGQKEENFSSGSLRSQKKELDRASSAARYKAPRRAALPSILLQSHIVKHGFLLQ